MEFLAVVIVAVFAIFAYKQYEKRKNKVSQKGDIPFDPSDTKDPNKQED